MTLHAALSSEQVGLGSIVPHGCQSWAQCRAQRPVTPAPSRLGRHGVDVTSCLVGRSAVSSHRPTDVAGVVGRINWTRRSIGEIGRGRGDGVIVELASSEIENRHLI